MDMNGPTSGQGDPSLGSSIMVLGRSANSSMNSHTAALDMNHLQMSLASFSQDLTLEEAVRHLQELFSENQELKRVLEDNNKFIREKHQEWATQKKDQAEELARRQEQARKVVAQLKEMVAERDLRVEALEKSIFTQGNSSAAQNRIAELEQQVKNQKHQLLEYIESKSDTEEMPSPTSDQLSELRIKYEKEILEQKNKVATLESAVMNYQKQLQVLNVAVSELKDSKVQINKEIEDNEGAMCKLQEINERLLAEKRELVALNNQLTTQLQTHKERSSPVDSEQDRDFVVVEREMARGEAESARAVAVRRGQDSPSGGGISQPRLLKGSEDQTVSDLLMQLQEERNTVSRLITQVHAQNAKLSEYERHLAEKATNLAGVKAQLSSKVSQLTQEHQQTKKNLLMQVDTMASELQKSRQQPSEHMKDVQSLRAQVLSLVGELHESEQKLQAAKSTVERHKQKCSDLQSKVEATQSELESQRTKDDQLIEALRCAISSLEVNLESEKKEHALKGNKLQELRKNFDQLCGDYHELLTQYEDLKSQQQGGMDPLATPSLSYASQRPYQERIDELTAQVMVAEEALAARDDDIRRLKMEARKHKEDLDAIAVHKTQGKDNQGLQDEVEKLREAVETIPVLKAQAEVFKADFEAERAAREKMVTEREQLVEDIQQLQLRNQQLEDEYQAVANDQFTTMQRRHAARSSYGAAGGIAHQPTHQPNMEGNANLRHAMSHGCGYPRYTQPQGEDTIDGRRGQSQVQNQSQDGVPSVQADGTSLQTDGADGFIRPEEIGQKNYFDQGPDFMTCPKCERNFPDYDSLQIHLVECIDSEAPQW